MASSVSDSKFCATCSDRKNPNSAEMYCKDCQIYLCMMCFRGHEQIPVCQDHVYISSIKAATIVDKESGNKIDINKVGKS